MNQPQPFNVLGDWRHGKILYNRHDRYIGRSLEVYGEFSEGEVALFGLLLKPGMLVLDIGANIGCHTVPMAAMVGPAGRVYAFEPQRIVFQTLCANLALNSVANVHAMQLALGSAPGSLRQMAVDYDDENNFGGVELGEDQQGEEVEVRRLDDLDLRGCAFIKLDVEGMEREVLAGATALIAAERPWMYVENDRPDRSAALKQYIHDLGYDMFWHTPRLFNPDNFRGHPVDIFDEICSRNMLCIPRELGIEVPGLEPVRLS
ncbi:FkbM family methyltransferase [Chitinimonas koreensis]|uniref:FkbM family methyltransferase n=1 Tax=Chitinimonas koreensis TaxID=356302 RepID=UPI00041A3D75|nr:FkbM family methyltransferase [Chitinimonas koreensis]QNM97382.1 FkbM family methyltransferase [Chitinimonas koreensis]